MQCNGEAKMERGVMRVVRRRDGGEDSEEGLLKRCTCMHTHAHTNTSQVLGNKHALKTIENTHWCLSDNIYIHINIPVLSLILVLSLFRTSYYSIHYHNSNQPHNHLFADVS